MSAKGKDGACANRCCVDDYAGDEPGEVHEDDGGEKLQRVAIDEFLVRFDDGHDGAEEEDGGETDVHCVAGDGPDVSVDDRLYIWTVKEKVRDGPICGGNGRFDDFDHYEYERDGDADENCVDGPYNDAA